MPYSEREKFEWSINKIADNLQENRLTTIIDVGVGAGLWEEYLKPYRDRIFLWGIEVWTPYLQEFNLLQRYDLMCCMDARQINNWAADIVIFGDILEHMPLEDAVALWDRAGTQSQHRLLAIPTVYYPQGHIHDNPYEAHVTENWTHEDVLNTFKGITDYSPQYPYTRAYWT